MLMASALQFDGAGGVRLAADSFGDPCSPVVLMLHGGGQTRHAWRATAACLAHAGWHAVTVDLRGHGESAHPRPAAYAPEDFADDIRALISATAGSTTSVGVTAANGDALAGAPAPAAVADGPVVIGASLGGIAALLALVESPPAPAAGLVLVDVAHRFQPRGGGRVVSFMEQHPEGFASLADAGEAVAAYLPNRPRPRDTSGLRHNLRRKGERWVWHWDPEVLTEARSIMEDPSELSVRLARATARLRQPCLLVRGADSDVLSAAIAQEFVELAPRASVVEVPRAGHMVAGDNNDAFTATIAAWLSAYPRVSRSNVSTNDA
jgi:pimeloyl-ACP methyl ester carboxylesterase